MSSPPAVAPASRPPEAGWRLVSARHPPGNLTRLFPELARPGGRIAAMLDRLPQRRGTAVHLAQAELEAPPFRPGAPWISGRLVAMRRDGADLPGWLAQAVLLPAEADERGEALLARLAAARVGGTFWAPAPDLPRGRGRILLCLPDAPAAATRLIEAARARHEATRLVSFAPSAAVARQARASGCTVVLAPCDPWPLLDAAEEVHVAAETPLALLALAAGRRLVCHAPIAFAGWGVSEDDPAIPPRGRRSPGALAAAALLGAARCADPFRDRPCTPEEAIDLLAEWRRLGDVGRGIGSLVGIAWWKRREVMAMLNHGDAPAELHRSPARAVRAAARRRGAVVAWPSVMPAALPAQARAAGVPLWQIEDGFVRSVGLGADSMPPYSLVIDRRGIYFDPAQPSELEHILQHAVFSPALLARAAALTRSLVERRISKYNTGRPPRPLAAPPGRRVVLVPGQVTDDRSVLLGGAGIRDNLTLLVRVRAAAPDAWLVYKPHPDVDAGQRAGALRDADALRHADAVVRDAAMPALLEQVDEVHTLTSLAGFEALLRGRRVVVFGQPFYAGWGLTEDHAPLPRRTRRLTLDELVAGTLLLYPRYLDPVTLLPCPVEVLLERLDEPSLWRPGPRILMRRLWGRLRRVLGVMR